MLSACQFLSYSMISFYIWNQNRSKNFFCTMPKNGNNYCKRVNNYSNRENETPTKAENAKITHLENVYPYEYVVWSAVFLISSYGAPLAQGASYLALHSSLFGPVAKVIMIILSLKALSLY